MRKPAEGAQTRVKAANLKNLAAGLLLLCSWPLAALKPAASQPAGPQMRIEVRGQALEASYPQTRNGTQAPSLREIVDPCLGTRWQLVADAQHPERPRRLVLVNSGVYRVSNPSPAGSVPPSVSLREASPVALPVIRAGDRITVLQQTSILRARLQAVALESGAAGQTLRVRLLGGADTLTGNQGTVVDVRAMQAGEAVWLAVDRNSQ
jgi:hypothetical protein